MPFAIDEEKLNTDPLKVKPGQTQVLALDPAKPPIISIPHMDFPRVVYKHPKEPYKTILHRNAKHEVVHEEIIPAEHLTLKVNDAKELAAALKEGWIKEPYIAQAPEDPNAHIYDSQ